MQLFRFEAEVGRAVDRYGSRNVVLARIARLAGNAQVVCLHLGPGGIVGYHQAVVPQLFLVVQGEGWVRGEAPDRVAISAGRAAFWAQGEGHESGTDTGMTAIVIEGEGLDPADWMPR